MMKRQRHYTLTSWLLAMVSATFLSGALADTDITTACPASYAEGENAEVKCTINTTAASSVACNASTVSIQYSKSTSGVNYLCKSARCASASGTCVCGISSGVMSVYTVIFKPDVNTHNGVDIKCTLNCLSVGSLSTSASGKCQSISVVSQTTVASTMTTQPAEMSSVATSSSSTKTVTNAYGGGVPSNLHGSTTGIILTILMSGLAVLF